MSGTLVLSCTKPDLDDGEVSVPNTDRFSRTLRVLNSGSKPLVAGTSALLTLRPGSREDFIVPPGQDLVVDVVGGDRAGASVHIAHIAIV